jgi:hypothetical protein
MENIDISKLLQELLQWKTLGFLGLVAFFGILGGAAKKYVTPKDKRKSDWSYIIVGASSAIAILLVITPKDAIMLVALSIAAGYAGKAVLDNLGISKRLAAANKKLEEEEAKKENHTNELNKVKKKIEAVLKNVGELNLPKDQVISLTKEEGIDAAEPLSAFESLKSKPGAIQNELHQIIGKLETMENSQRADLKKPSGQ